MTVTYQIGFHPDKGRALIATQDIPKGGTVMICRLLILNPKETKIVLNNTVLGDYFFAFDKNRTCLVFGDAMLMNHSTDPNVCWEVVKLGAEEVFRYYALSKITEHTELLIDYGHEVIEFKRHRIHKQLTGKRRDRQ